VVVVVVGLPLIDRCLEVDPDLFRLVEGDLDLDQDRIESIESGLWKEDLLRPFNTSFYVGITFWLISVT